MLNLNFNYEDFNIEYIPNNTIIEAYEEYKEEKEVK